MSDEPAPKWGFACLCCNQRIVPFKPRIPVKGRPLGSTESVRLLGFRHPGCSLARA